MGLVSKLKNILFEEEEVEIPVIEKKEKKAPEPAFKEMPKKEEVVQTPNYSNFYQEAKEPIKEEKPEPVKENNIRYQREPENNYNEIVSEREIFKSEKTFNFPAFDEEEFESALPRRTTNVLEHERKKETKKKEYQAPTKREEPKEIKNKFRPSPIISPVYGILDKNYTPDEITTRESSLQSRALDVDSVRKKAFGTLEETLEIPKVEINEEDNDEKILEEKLEKARTIDELLKDSSDDVIDLSDTKEELEPLEETIESLEDIEPKHEENVEEDTLESDLFDLIDSMYENREDGE